VFSKDSGSRSRYLIARPWEGKAVLRPLMAKLVLTPMLLLIPVPAPADANTGSRPVDGKVHMESLITRGVEPWSMVQFMALKGGMGYERGGFSLVLYRSAPRRWFFSKRSIGLRIDAARYLAPVVRTEQRMTGMYTVLTVCAVYIRPELGERLRGARQVVLEIPFANRPAETWEVPGHALMEWKKVIQGSAP